MKKIISRFAPSPTGYLHIGGLRTALFNYLWAKKNNGQFLLRIEDTDQNRLVEGAAENLIKILREMGLDFDNQEPMIQSKRIKIYQEAAKNLVAEKKAYYCFCSAERLENLRESQQAKKQMPRYDRHCLNLSPEEIEEKLAKGEKHVIRFYVPSEKKTEVNDLVYGKITVNNLDLDDFIILKSDGFPTYHLANIIDDHEMQISHAIRGEEWLPSLPKHYLLYQAFGWENAIPEFVHLPLLLNPDRSKLSKRQGDVAVEDFLAKGYLKEALLNYVALLGWNPGTDQEFFSLKDLEKEFSLEKINKAGAIFDLQKLNWFNAEYIRQAINNQDATYQNILNESKKILATTYDLEKVLKVSGSRLNNLSELKEAAAFYYNLADYPAEMLIFKKSDLEKTKLGLNLALENLAKITEDQWQEKELFELLDKLIQDHNLNPGDLFWPVRVALSGQEKSPSPAEILWVLEKEESLKRLKQAVDKLS
ncbi:glutamate--tRNA ligase [Candidatus Nomurabacteria bacterium]|nr:glutamate--tRNA ligase [Candidatus Nomurabacteria bacterium]